MPLRIEYFGGLYFLGSTSITRHIPEPNSTIFPQLSATQTIHSTFITAADFPIPPGCLKPPSSESTRGRIKSFLGTPFKYLRILAHRTNRKYLRHPCRHHIQLGSSLCAYKIEEALPNPVDIHALRGTYKASTEFGTYAFILKY